MSYAVLRSDWAQLSVDAQQRSEVHTAILPDGTDSADYGSGGTDNGSRDGSTAYVPIATADDDTGYTSLGNYAVVPQTGRGSPIVPALPGSPLTPRSSHMHS